MKGDFTRWTFEPTKHYGAVLDQQGRVKTDADKLEEFAIERHLRQESLRDIVGISGAPADNAGFGLRRDPEGNLIIAAGCFYVDGILCENEHDVSFTEQPDLPGQDLPDAEGDTRRFLAYLDVWERHITAIEDPEIREVALGGTDTTTRVQTVCGVRLFEVDGDAHCLSPLPDWEQAIAPGDGQLAARAQPPEDSDTPCLIPPDAGYTGLENQLYRVEIHRGGQAGVASFKWAGDNASIQFPIAEFVDGQPADRVRLGLVGKWDLHALNAEDLIEITDDRRELQGEAGELRQIRSIDPATGIITLDAPVEGLSQDHHPKVIRWSGGTETTVPADDNTFLALENGVEVRFAGNRFRAGDYWLIPARTATRNVEWPTEIRDDDREEPLPRPPLGIKHHHARLAMLEFGGGEFDVVSDCRTIFSALSQPFLRVTRVVTAATDRVLPNNGTIRAELLANGLDFTFSAPLSPDIFEAPLAGEQGLNPMVEVQLYLPEPYTPEERNFWGLASNEFFGFRAVTLAGEISLHDTQRQQLQWRADERTRAWLTDLFARLIPPGQNQPIVDFIPCTLRIRGRFVWADGPGGDPVFLHGESTANARRRVGLDLPSSGGRPVSDFVRWIRVGSGDVQVPLNLSVNVRLNEVSGTVSSSGAPVEGATVRLRRVSGPGPGAGSERTTVSDAAGRFTFTGVLQGGYTVTAEARGATAEERVEVERVIVPPGDGGGGPGGPGDLTVREINGIGPRFTELLEANGVRSVRAFLELSPSRIATILGVSEARAGQLLNNARLLTQG